MIEVNEYVRTNTGYIAKLKQYLSNTGTYLFDDFIQEIQGDKYICISENELEKVIVKHSKELIDLVEVGDYVNGYRVINVINEGPCPSGKCVDIDSSKDSSECTLWEEDIETILTKEQYLVNCYKVGGEEICLK